MADNPPVSVELLETGLASMADVLARRQVNYAVIGGMAAGFRSQPRLTKDLDFKCRNWRLRLFWKTSCSADSQSIDRLQSVNGRRTT